MANVGSSGMNFSGASYDMGADGLPSEKAEAARMRSAEIMAALKKGGPGDADALMGKNTRVAADSAPQYSERAPGMANSANSSSWNTSPFAFAPNTNAMDANSMPSDKAAAARMRSAEVMAALKSGEPGDADAIMGKQQQKGTQGIVPLQWLKRKMGNKSAKTESAVVR
ncbi:hypothetical protein LTR85_008522 [Meristemomyces frigidus]|nr:hypothetical protein LTR85_008522 [Meristemomyces frigidus]